MCGIAGIYAYGTTSQPVDREELVRIRDAMRTRGPDGSGVWHHHDARLSFGHRRLSIIDLSERGRQPMELEDGTCVITYNGEIYNYKVLREELEANGRVFQSDSDTEVLLHLYAERGTAMFDALRGMYAFAIWDERRRRLLLARDPYGIKPLYVADDGATLRFASQVTALRAGGAVSRQPDPAGVAGFYLFGSVPEPHTCFTGVRAIPAGSYQIWTESGPATIEQHDSITRRWHDAALAPQRSRDSERQDRITAALRDSVAHHLVSDVPVGAFLSAGIDSTTLVALMRDISGGDVQTLTMAFAEFRGGPRDEAPLAEEVAARYGTRHETRVVSRDDFVSSVPAILEAMDQPSVDGINTWLVSRATHELGLKVAVSGLGGDELFAGYPNTFGAIPKMVRLLRLPSRLPVLPRAWRQGMSALRSRFRINPKLASLLELGGGFAGAYLLRRGCFMPWELADVMAPAEVEEGLRRLDPIVHVQRAMTPDPVLPYARIAALEASLYMRNQLLRDSDWASMAHSLELRVPLVDAVLLQSLAPLLAADPAKIDKRWLAAAASPPLPKAVINKPKTGFGIPIAEWIGTAQVAGLDTWRSVPALADPACPWARRLGYALVRRALS